MKTMLQTAFTQDTPQLPTTDLESTVYVTITVLATTNAPVLSSTVTTVASTTSTTNPSPTEPTPVATWTSPPDMTDLASFSVQAPFYSSNLHFVSSIPHSASSSTPTSPSPELNKLQALYPKGSVNPARKIKGGADFYANPLAPGVLERARNVSLSYRAFFPAGFAFVKGGKMPGLYGGTRGCAGGADAGAARCFSTRLMWRAGGVGELYLYAPRDEQGPDVCKTEPKSVCADAYGMSIGRGSFAWRTGVWTSVRQTVTLNTPGEQDGQFVLDVDGTRAMDVAGVFYRGKPTSGGAKDGDSADDDDELVGSVIADLEHDLQAAPAHTPVRWVPYGPEVKDALAREESLPLMWNQDHQLVFGLSRTRAHAQPNTLQSAGNKAGKENAAGFAGIFFSTFFGGHDADWASPKDQYVWFDSFEINVWV
jgi:hypothetical protein